MKLISKLDIYLIKKFLGTYIFSILIIISIMIVFDFNDSLDKFTTNQAPWKRVILDYYANFIPYYANLFSPLFVFISVIFFTSKLAGNSEIIAMLSTGVSFNRLLKPYMISAGIIAVVSFVLGSYFIPRGNVTRLNFETQYKNKKKTEFADNVQLQVDTGVIAFMQSYVSNIKTGYNFSLDSFHNKKLITHLTASSISYDTLAEDKYRWIIYNYTLREMKGRREKITSGARLEKTIAMEPSDFVYVKHQQEAYTNDELLDYIAKQRLRGAGNVASYELEYYKRFASPCSAFILTIIGVSLSSRKRKGGMGIYLSIGLFLSFAYIMFQTIFSTFATNAGWPPYIAVWIPNILFAFIAYYCYTKAPR